MSSLHGNSLSPLTDFSASTTFSPLNSFFTPNELHVVTVALVMISVIGTIQNLMVVVAMFVSRNRLLDIPSNWFVLSLATADLFVCGISVPIYIIHLHAFFWEPFLGFGQFTTLISGGSLFLLTFNRFLSVYDTLSYMKRMTVFRAQLFTMGMWFLAVTLTIITTVGKNYDMDNLVFLSIVYYVMINLLTVAFHLYMFRASFIKTKAIRGQRVVVLSGQQKNLIQEYNHLFRLVIVVGTYVITWVPFSATLSGTPEKEERLSRSFQRQFALFYTLLATNSAVDPFLYFLRSQEFKMFTQKVKRYLSPSKRRVESHIVAFHIHRSSTS